MCSKKYKGALPNSFYEARSALLYLLTADKNVTRKEKYRTISLMNINIKPSRKILTN